MKKGVVEIDVGGMRYLVPLDHSENFLRDRPGSRSVGMYDWVKGQHVTGVCLKAEFEAKKPARRKKGETAEAAGNS